MKVLRLKASKMSNQTLVESFTQSLFTSLLAQSFPPIVLVFKKIVPRKRTDFRKIAHLIAMK